MQMKPSVGRHCVNDSAESSARSPNLESSPILDKVTSRENSKRNVAEFGKLPKSGANQGVR